MLIGQPSRDWDELGYSDELGFSVSSLNPVKVVKKVGRGVKKGVVAVGSGVKKGTVATYKFTKKTVKSAAGAAADVGKAIGKGVLKPFEFIAHQAVKPIKNRVVKLRNRRAAKLAWDARKSKTPNAQEQAAAKAWTKSHLKSKGPHGQVLALLAGSEWEYGEFHGYDNFGNPLGMEPATASLIAASIPIFMALMNKVLGSADKSGEAPANPGADAAANAEAPDTGIAADGATAAAPGGDGSVDLTPVQDAVADVAQQAADGAASAAGMVRVPGVGLVKRNHMLIGAGVVGVILLLALTSRRGD